MKQSVMATRRTSHNKNSKNKKRCYYFGSTLP